MLGEIPFTNPDNISYSDPINGITLSKERLQEERRVTLGGLVRIGYMDLAPRRGKTNETVLYYSQRFIDFMGQPKAREHFMPPIDNLQQLTRYIFGNDKIFFVGVNMDGYAMCGGIIERLGRNGIITIMKLAVGPDFQTGANQEPNLVAEQFVYALLNYTFASSIFKPDEPRQVFIGHIAELEGSEKMEKLEKRMGFTPLNQFKMHAQILRPGKNPPWFGKIVLGGKLTEEQFYDRFKNHVEREFRIAQGAQKKPLVLATISETEWESNKNAIAARLVKKHLFFDPEIGLSHDLSHRS